MKNKELDNMLDKVATEIRGEQIESATVNDAAERVWMRMSSQSGVAASEASVTAGAAEHIESCADFQSLMPAYVGRELSEARALLLVDHTHECIPCRRALKEARTARLPAGGSHLADRHEAPGDPGLLAR